MGLAASSAQMFMLTRRKADCEYKISKNSVLKRQKAREMSQLNDEYQRQLKQKTAVVYTNGVCNKVNYSYLMCYGSNLAAILNGSQPLKSNTNMVLADNHGRVVLSNSYAQAIMNVCGSSIINYNGQGQAFDKDKIPEILESLFNHPTLTADAFRNGIKDYDLNATIINTYTGNATGSTTVNVADRINDMIDRLVAFYYPIFSAAAANGWTTEYNYDMQQNSDYCADALNSGLFQLVGVDKYGQYREGMNTDYFVTTGDILKQNDKDDRAALTTWFNEEERRINEEEEYIDIDTQKLSTELNAIQTEIDAIKSYIDDNIERTFSWGGGS